MIAGRDFVKFCKQPGHNLTAILMINKDVDKDKSLSVHWSLHLVGKIWIIVNFSNVLAINHKSQLLWHWTAHRRPVFSDLWQVNTRLTFQLSNTGPKQHLAVESICWVSPPSPAPAALLWWASTSPLLHAFLTFTFNLFRSDTSQWLCGDPYDLGQSWRGMKQVFKVKHGGNVGFMGIIKRFEGNGLKQLCQSWSFPFCFYQLLRVSVTQKCPTQRNATQSLCHIAGHTDVKVC